MSRNQKTTLASLIRNYIWADKIGGRVRQGVLNLGFEQGGLQLVDIGCKIKAQRIKRIMYLLSVDDDNIERFLADALIGKDNRFGQNGLSYGMISNLDLINRIKNDFYKNALQAVNSIEITFKPASLRHIQHEPVFYNKMFLNSNEQVFTLSRFKRSMPKTVKQLQITSNSGEPFVWETIRTLRLSQNSLTFSNLQENMYIIEFQGSQYDLKSLDFKVVYLYLLEVKNEIREWEAKWCSCLSINSIDWKVVWGKIHNNINHPRIKSASWELIHLNFWCGYKARERCKLCGEEELDTTHIVNECKVLIEILKAFHLYAICNSKMAITFGLDNDDYHNFILFHIKCVVFKSRFKQFNSKAQAIRALENKTRYAIKKDLGHRFEQAKKMGKLSDFTNMFKIDIQDNSIRKLCSINQEGDLLFLI